MARRVRYVVSGHSVHIIRRGINRGAICRDDEDRDMLLATVRDASRACATAFHGFAILDTHYHGLATPVSTEELSRTMQLIGERYVRYFNRKHGRIGTLWTGRFTSIDVDTEEYWLRCLRYIEQNPVRARIVSDPADYRWSSYRANALGEPMDWLVEHPVYLSLASTSERRRLAYRAMCHEPLKAEELALLRIPSRAPRPLAALVDASAALAPAP